MKYFCLGVGGQVHSYVCVCTHSHIDMCVSVCMQMCVCFMYKYSDMYTSFKDAYKVEIWKLARNMARIYLKSQSLLSAIKLQKKPIMMSKTILVK